MDRNIDKPHEHTLIRGITRAVTDDALKVEVLWAHGTSRQLPVTEWIPRSTVRDGYSASFRVSEYDHFLVKTSMLVENGIL